MYPYHSNPLNHNDYQAAKIDPDFERPVNPGGNRPVPLPDTIPAVPPTTLPGTLPPRPGNPTPPTTLPGRPPTGGNHTAPPVTVPGRPPTNGITPLPAPAPGPGRPQAPPPSQNRPTSPPPGRIPPRAPALRAIDAGAIRGCMFNFTYVWLNNGNEFWFFPTYLGARSIAGFRWQSGRWSYIGFDLNSIEGFSCSQY